MVTKVSLASFTVCIIKHSFLACTHSVLSPKGPRWFSGYLLISELETSRPRLLREQKETPAPNAAAGRPHLQPFFQSFFLFAFRALYLHNYMAPERLSFPTLHHFRQKWKKEKQRETPQNSSTAHQVSPVWGASMWTKSLSLGSLVG